MSDIILRSAVKAQSTKNAVIERLATTLTRLREEDGQDMIEYAGVLIVIAVIVVGVAALAKGNLVSDIVKDMDNLVNNLLGSGKAPAVSTTGS